VAVSGAAAALNRAQSIMKVFNYAKDRAMKHSPDLAFELLSLLSGNPNVGTASPVSGPLSQDQHGTTLEPDSSSESWIRLYTPGMR
jgi:hypothetical protein